MKIIVIPDVHLKPWMFERASELMDEEKLDGAVCLMDLPDTGAMARTSTSISRRMMQRPGSQLRTLRQSGAGATMI